MNQRALSPAPAGLRRAWFVMPLLLLGLATEIAQSTAPPLNAEEAPLSDLGRAACLPYLRFIGPPPLRIQESLPPPDLSSRPPPAGPPKTGGNSKPDIVHGPVQDVPVMAPPPSPVATIVSSAPPKLAPRTQETPAADQPAQAGPAPLLPDDGRARVRPEDFLPFFQFPSASQSQSTATYQQQ